MPSGRAKRRQCSSVKKSSRRGVTYRDWQAMPADSCQRGAGLPGAAPTAAGGGGKFNVGGVVAEVSRLY